jgi:hypothetical protein
MAVLSKGTTFATGDQVTATKLNNLVDSSTFASGAVDNTTTQLSGGAIIVKDGGIATAKLADSTGVSDGVTFAKLQQAAANTVLVRDANSTGAVSAKAVADTQILIGDGDGFAAASLSGDVTMTNAGVVSIAATSGATGTTATTGDSSTKLATTAFVDASIMQYSGTTGTHAATDTFSDLDLSSTVGSNRAFIILEVAGNTTSNLFFRTKGSSITNYFGASNAGYGASGTTVRSDGNEGGTICVVSDASGVIEARAVGTSCTISYTILAFQRLA